MWELSRKTYILSIYKVSTIKSKSEKKDRQIVLTLWFLAEINDTLQFFKYFLGKYILLDLYWTEPEGRSLEAFPIGTKNSWNERILSLSFLLFWYSNGSHYHLLHIDTCQCFFSWDSCSGFGVYIRTLHIWWYNILKQNT